jgi:hypothetical protein
MIPPRTCPECGADLYPDKGKGRAAFKSNVVGFVKGKQPVTLATKIDTLVDQRLTGDITEAAFITSVQELVKKKQKKKK